MSKTKRVILLVLGLCGILIGLRYYHLTPVYAPLVSFMVKDYKYAYHTIQPGMTIGDVQTILGRPLSGTRVRLNVAGPEDASFCKMYRRNGQTITVWYNASQVVVEKEIP